MVNSFVDRKTLLRYTIFNEPVCGHGSEMRRKSISIIIKCPKASASTGGDKPISASVKGTFPAEGQLIK